GIELARDGGRHGGVLVVDQLNDLASRARADVPRARVLTLGDGQARGGIGHGVDAAGAGANGISHGAPDRAHRPLRLTLTLFSCRAELRADVSCIDPVEVAPEGDFVPDAFGARLTSSPVMAAAGSSTPAWCSTPPGHGNCNPTRSLRHGINGRRS